MARSFIDPSLVEMALPKGPGWEWNPGATFVTAFNNAQENRRANEKMALDQELAAILLPYKQQTAALELEKLQQEVERSTFLTKRIREGGAIAHRGIMQGLQNPNQPSSSIGQWNTTVRLKKSSGVTPQMIQDVDSQIALPDEDTLIPPDPANP
jgi:hypothetical protein